MADASQGRVSSMPGSVHRVPVGTDCDNHPGVQAVKRIQGETDSFGCEYADLCQVCADKDRAYREQQLQQECYCEWCKQMKTNVRPHRDFEEGQAGRLYNVCGDCRMRESVSLAEEAADHDRGDFDDPGDWDDSDALPDYAMDAEEPQSVDADPDPTWNASDGHGA